MKIWSQVLCCYEKKNNDSMLMLSVWTMLKITCPRLFGMKSKTITNLQYQNPVASFVFQFITWSSVEVSIGPDSNMIFAFSSRLPFWSRCWRTSRTVSSSEAVAAVADIGRRRPTDLRSKATVPLNRATDLQQKPSLPTKPPLNLATVLQLKSTATGPHRPL